MWGLEAFQTGAEGPSEPTGASCNAAVTHSTSPNAGRVP